MGKTILDIQGLRKTYGQHEVLKGVDCTMEEGEVISIIGSSGSGKTTMLRCINMLEGFQGARSASMARRSAITPTAAPAAARARRRLPASAHSLAWPSSNSISFRT